jgi:hypothetical protein
MHLNVDSDGERGLLGVAVDPNFASNHFLYAYYTVPGSPAHNRVSRFVANGDVVQAGSETVLLDLDNLSTATNHNGGSLNFGTDGKLYIGVGENATGSNSQTLGNLLGKMLRINSDGTIPTDNPFFSTATGKNRAIWAMGLRNPFTFDVENHTGKIFINDVGQSTWEEIDQGAAGANYGWPNEEGPDNGNPNFVDPIFAYQHNAGQPQGIAITGGSFYSDAANPSFPPAFANDYYFADLGGNFIWRFDPTTHANSKLAQLDSSNPVALLTGPTGDLFYLVRSGTSGTGELRSIHYTSKPPQIENIGGAVTYPAGSQAGVRLSSTVTVADPDNANFQAGRLRLGFVSGDRVTDQLFIKPAGNFSLTGRTIKFDGQIIGGFSGGTSGKDLVITFNARGTVPVTRGLLRTIYFRNTTTNPGTTDRVIAIRLSDGDGGVSPRVLKRVHVSTAQSSAILPLGPNNASQSSSTSAARSSNVVVPLASSEPLPVDFAPEANDLDDI